MATTAEDVDTLEAVKAYWDANADLQALCGFFKSSLVKSPQAMPYAKGECAKGETPNVYMAEVKAGNGYVDYRHLTVTGYGTKEQMAQLAALFRSKLNWLPRDGLTLTYPSGATLMAVRPLNNTPAVEPDKTTKDAKDIWKCVGEWEVGSSRAVA